MGTLDLCFNCFNVCCQNCVLLVYQTLRWAFVGLGLIGGLEIHSFRTAENKTKLANLAKENQELKKKIEELSPPSA